MIKEDVNELATRTGQGIAYYSGSKRRDVGSAFCRAGTTTGLLAFLNNMVGVFEYEVDENGNSGGKIWEWKTCCYQSLELISIFCLKQYIIIK
jgi:hypothetical protein